MKSIALALAFTVFGCTEADNQRNRPPILNPSAQEANPASVRSQLHRMRTTVILSSAQESGTALNLPVGYDDVPNILEADDGLGVEGRSVVLAAHSGRSCGIGADFANIAARIQDCATINASLASWNGQENGNAGEGNWALVSKNGIGQEVWIDKTTNMLWSDRITDSMLWCVASGNSQTPSEGGVVDCQVLNPDRRELCNDLNVLPADQVSWRLPTRGDFLQADLNGARYVLRHTSSNYWTATVSGLNRDEAWSIIQSSASLTTASRAEGRAVRCIGRVLK